MGASWVWLGDTAPPVCSPCWQSTAHMGPLEYSSGAGSVTSLEGRLKLEMTVNLLLGIVNGYWHTVLPYSIASSCLSLCYVTLSALLLATVTHFSDHSYLTRCPLHACTQSYEQNNNYYLTPYYLFIIYRFRLGYRCPIINRYRYSTVLHDLCSL